ncbi:MAG: class I SAM-dependent methyltransferase [Bosea sp.]|uniref:class I SAM-dependent methyltransferase n=1 Tax=unclassified Bosea (in: a-proteobacteria) TaxID=2653178 RepID=UPI000963827D|nr:MULTISPECIES: class I SAM-dependent methyltransferase [unclassified Bosea (in: a-proteobacteria)]MBN9455989.1 class I SAM-dependent methyltransferase [Bosea sp. (in: a-proteobacteria)]OJV06049.1 MAG: SAM-dependent methyltransferase [Bosea sp. 67-29]
MRAADPQKLDDLMGRLVGDVGASVTGALIVLGDQLGLYKAMADGKPVTSQAMAARTGFKERYIREWLAGQAAAGYVDYDEASDSFSLSPEQAMAFAEEDSPAFFAGAFEVVQSMWVDEPKVEEAFRSGKGLGWHEHSTCLFRGTERFFRPGYNAHLTATWIPALDGVEDKLLQGASVADVGCGHGSSTILMAQAYPKSRFFGFDYHGPSIERAREAAEQAGVGDRIVFERASAKDFPEGKYDLVTMFDCLHDMGDPVGAGRHVKEALAADGSWMIVEPFACDSLKENLNPVGRIYYGASTMICTPASLSQEVGLGLGAQAGEMRLRKVALDAGFSHFHRATETPFNMVFEVKS